MALFTRLVSLLLVAQLAPLIFVVASYGLFVNPRPEDMIIFELLLDFETISVILMGLLFFV